ncbi:MAG TPA: hypothetical protein VMF88_14095 [Bacteroidota bacterium]|nr:hypothetical protein [Bacteroidota bacterium]
MRIVREGNQTPNEQFKRGLNIPAGEMLLVVTGEYPALVKRIWAKEGKSFTL